MPDLTPKYLLADTLLGGTFQEFVVSRRKAGRAWRHIASELFAATDQKVDVTAETLRTWFPDEPDGDTNAEAKAS